MPKKKINNRLNKLFENIKSNEPPAQPKRAKKTLPQTARLNPDSVPANLIQAQVADAVIASAPVPRVQKSDAAVLSLAFQSRENDWATMRILDETTNSRVWSEDDQLLVRQVTDQLSLALENARLFQEEQKRAAQLQSVSEISSAVSTILNPQELLSTFVYLTRQRFSLYHTHIFILEKDNHTLDVKACGWQEESLNGTQESRTIDINQPVSIVARAARTLQPVILNNVRENPAWLPNPDLPDVQSEMAIPVISQEKLLIGVLNIHANKINAFDENDSAIMTTLATQIGAVIQNTHLFNEIRERNEQLAAVNEIMSSAGQTLEIHSILKTVLERILHATNFDGGLITMFNASRGKLERAVRIGMPGQPPADPAEGLDQSLCKYVFDTQQDLVIPNLGLGAPIDVSGEVQAGLHGYIGIPLESKGKALGTLCIFRYANERIPEKAVSLCKTVAVQLGFTIENARLFDESRRFRLGLEGSSDAVFLTDMTGTIVYVNPSFEKIYGYTAPEALGKTPRIIKSGLMPKEQYEYFWGTLLNKGTVSGEITNRSKDGRLLTVAGSNSPILDETGNILGFLAVHQDITEKKNAEEKLKISQESITRSEGELRALFLAMSDVIIVYDKDGRYIRIAPTNPSRLFIPPQDMIGKTIKEVLPQHVHEPMMSAIQETLKTELPVQLEYWLDIEGQIYWFDASFSRLSEDQVFLVAKDITERKKAEGSLKRRDEYLAASSEIGRKITSTLDLETIFSRAVNLVAEQFDLYHTAIYTVEETGFNAVLRNGTGVAGQEMKKQKHKLPIKPNTVIGSVISKGEAVIVTDTTTNAVYKPNRLLPETRSEAGIPLRVGSRVTGVLDLQSSHPNAFQPDDIAVLQTLADQIAIAIDNARSYELSQQAVREMREVDRLKSQFLANMSHELRTPLNSIIGFSRVIIKGIDGPVTELQQQDLTAIYNSGQHLLALINDILDLAKIEAGKMELAFDEVNMSDVINSVLATVTGLIKDKPVTITKNIAADMPTVRADAIRIRQVLINLFSNASKFTDEGTITVAASVRDGENSRPEIIVSVTDTGPGIAPEDQAKLFQAFSQVDDSPTRKTGGTGLGLSISQNLIQMHGGQIGVDSVVGKGSTFYFTLPAFRGNQPLNEPQSNAGGKIILAIDDDPQVISLYERYLQPQGYQVVAVTEPGKAKERAIQLKPFAITLDIMMPGYDGWQVLNELKSTPETRNIPVVICSIIEDHEKGFSLGAADYLAKPILEEDLLTALDGLNKDNLIEEILVIDDNPNDLQLIGKMLTDQGHYMPTLVEGGIKGWDAITKKTPQAVILDLFMPGLDGFTILENMRADARLRDIPVIILTAGDLTADQKHQLAEFGPRLIAKSALNEKDLITSIEHALQRAAK
jgi:PAS domain S-box-containing protein